MLPRILLVLAALTVVHPEVVRVRSSGRNFLIRTDNNKKDWWQTATFYQIYPKSFKDSDGDGIGDLQGIKQQLDYIQSLGVSAIWLSPIYKSPLKDGGYDISDFRDINPQFGTLEDFMELLRDAHARGIKVILDFVPNHTSDQHPWFQLSANRVKGYEDYYIWADGKVDSAGLVFPPNNWLSVFKGSAWEYNSIRKQFYYHQFLKEQPDLNFRNAKVRQEMQDVLTYWLEVMDVDGVRIDAVPHLLEDDQLRDEPKNTDGNFKPTDYEYLQHIHTVNQDGSFELVYEWRSHLDGISKNKTSTRVMMTEAATDIDNVIRYYGQDEKKGAHFSFNFWLEGLTKDNLKAAELRRIVSTWMEKLLNYTFTPNWVLGNHDTHRIASKVGEEKADGLNMLTGFLPGVQVTYAGEEIGMEDGEVDCEHGDDFHEDCNLYKTMSRDFERTPFQWDSSTTAGFSTNNTTWLPVSSKKDKCNVKMEEEGERSHLKTYKNIEKLRKELGNLSSNVDVFNIGDNDNVLQMIRYTDSDVKGPDDDLYAYHYFFNLNNNNVTFNFTDKVKLKKYIVLATSRNGNKNAGDILDDSQIGLEPYESVILKTYRSAATSLAGGILVTLAVIFHSYRFI